MTRPGIEPRSPGPLANTLTARPNENKVWFSDWVICLYFKASGNLMQQILVCAPTICKYSKT